MDISQQEISADEIDESILQTVTSLQQKKWFYVQEKNNGNEDISIRERANTEFIISEPQKLNSVFKVELDPDTQTGFKGLPSEFEKYLTTFTKEEIENNPKEVLQSIEQTINVKKDGQKYQKIAFQKDKLVSDSEFQTRINKLVLFKNEDPSKYYDIVKKLAVGGFAKVFEVKDLRTNQQLALKFIEPKT